MLEIYNLSKSYGQKKVISSCSIKINRGEIVGLLGPNGAGKTTSFYMIIGIIKPDSGKILLNNVDITQYPIYKRAQMGLGYLPQESSIFRDLSVEDNILSAIEMKFNIKTKRKEKLEQIIKEFHLENIRKNLGKLLSGGERRRVEVARMISVEPDYVFLDEPFAGVDPIAVKDIMRLMIELKQRNIGVVITDHNVRETLKIVDTAYILYQGEILLSGNSNDIINNKTVREVYLGEDFNI